MTALAHAPAADAARPIVEMLFGSAPVRVELWDGSTVGADDAPNILRLRSPG